MKEMKFVSVLLSLWLHRRRKCTRICSRSAGWSFFFCPSWEKEQVRSTCVQFVAQPVSHDPPLLFRDDLKRATQRQSIG